MGRPRKFTDRELRKALKEAGGKVSDAARLLRINCRTAYRRIEANPRLKAILENEKEAMLDLAESVLKKKVAEGEGWAVTFALKCQGKSRGYVERQAVEHSGSLETTPSVVQVVIDGNWYGNEEDYLAVANASPAAIPNLPRALQARLVGSEVGKNGNGSNGNGHGPRPDAGLFPRSN